jgi:hypothetical protein
MSGAAAGAVVQSAPFIFLSASCALSDAGSRGTNRGVVQTRGVSRLQARWPWSGGMRVMCMNARSRRSPRRAIP